MDKLKPDAPFLVYLYYALDNRTAWYSGAEPSSPDLSFLACRTVAADDQPNRGGADLWPLARVARFASRDGLEPTPTTVSARAWKSDSAAMRSSACSCAQDLKTSHFTANNRFGALSASNPTERLCPALAPGFQHQYVPEQILPVAAAFEMLAPKSPDHARLQ